MIEIFYVICHCPPCIELYWDNIYNKIIYQGKKENRYYIKKKYKNKKKSRHINLKNLKNKKQYTKFKSNKRNLNKYENDDYEDSYYDDDKDYAFNYF